MARTPNSASWRQAEAALGDVEAWLRQRRREGLSLTRIVALLDARGVIASHETIRNWCSRLGVES